MSCQNSSDDLYQVNKTFQICRYFYISKPCEKEEGKKPAKCIDTIVVLWTVDHVCVITIFLYIRVFNRVKISKNQFKELTHLYQRLDSWFGELGTYTFLKKKKKY